jgi:hypothetical protein
MSRRKPGSRIFGLLFLTVLCMTGLMASNAQALTWDLEGAEITEPVPFDGMLKEEFLLLTTIAGGSVLVIHCNQLQIHEGLLLPDNTAHLGLLLTECKTLVNGVNQKNCVPTILLAKLKILPILHNNKIYLLYESLTPGQPWTGVHYGPLCPLPLANITGSAVYECENGLLVPISCEEPKASHLIKPALPALFPLDVLKYGLNVATLHGELELLLTGKDTGMQFNALV